MTTRKDKDRWQETSNGIPTKTTVNRIYRRLLGRRAGLCGTKSTLQASVNDWKKNQRYQIQIVDSG
eukprot:9061637-Alexandrium_andersonii.AAC.1